MPLYKYTKLMLVAPIDFLVGGNYMGVNDCLFVCVLTFFVIWTIGVRDK